MREHLSAGDTGRALRLGEQLVVRLPAGQLHADALTTMAYHGVIELERAIAMCEQAASECRAPAARARCLLLLSNVVQTVDKPRALAIAREALALVGGQDDPALRAWALAQVGRYQAVIRPEDSRLSPLRQASALESRHGVATPDPYLGATTQLGMTLMLRDELDEARTLLVAAREAAAAAGRESEMVGPDLHLVELGCRAGNLDRARRYADESLAIRRPPRAHDEPGHRPVEPDRELQGLTPG